MKCTKIIIWCCMVFIISCAEPELPIAPPTATVNVFSVTENRISDGQEIHFNLPADGVYTLTIINKDNEQVISRERFIGKSGKNVKRIYTKSIQSKILYLLLEDEIKTNLGKTTIIV